MTSGRIWGRIARRNVRRNRRRTAITVGALALGFVASTVMIGLSEGIVAQMIENGTDLLTGQIRVHGPGYEPERSLYSTLGGRAGVDLDQMLAAIGGVAGIEAVTPRVYAGGLVSSGEETAAGILMGVDPELESSVSRILSGLEQGRLPRRREREVILGQVLADRLRAEEGSEIVLVAPAADGSMGNDVFRVVGVFRTGAAELDAAYVLLHIEVLQALVALDRGRVHELAASVDDVWSSTEVVDLLPAAISSLDVEVAAEPWTRFRPDLAEYAQLAASFNWIIVLIVFVMAVFGVANTMLMATWERRREFAVVRALGAPVTGIVRTVVSETMVLGVVAIALGVAVAAPIVFWWSQAPPDLSWIVGDFTMAGALVEANLRVEPSVKGPLLSATGLLITVFLAGLYPAVRSARQRPADTLAGAE